MEYGAHLPLMDFGGHPYRLDHLTGYAERASQLGFTALAANDHVVHEAPWLDGPTALAAVLDHSAAMTLATTVSLPVVRGPVLLAKTLGSLDRLSGGRMVVAVGPGSSERDYAAVGIDFAERWKRLDEAVGVLRVLWAGNGKPFVGDYCSTEGIDLRPRPGADGGPPIWIGSWGSQVGLNRVARLGDGWLASAYNTTPEGFAQAWDGLAGRLQASGKDPHAFPNALATMWCYITDDHAEADRILRQRVLPVVNRSEDELRARLPIGPPGAFAERLAAYRDAGVQRVYLWPVADEVHQLELFAERVVPLL